VETIYIGRFIVGMGTALSGIADIPYLTEISPPQYRGRLASAYEFLAVVGILASFCVNLSYSTQSGSWRLLFGLPALFAFIQAALMIFLPDSPKWLIQTGQDERGKDALRKALDTEEEVTTHFNEIRESYVSTNTNINNPEYSTSVKKVVYEYRWMFFCIMVLMFFQQSTGGVAVRNYAGKIFQNAGFSEQASLTYTVIVGVVKVITVGISIYNVREGDTYIHMYITHSHHMYISRYKLERL
jgi:MFS family permease